MSMRDDENEQPQRQVISEQDIKLLFVTPREIALHHTFKFLKKRNWNYIVVPTMKEAFDIMAQEKPTHVFMSFGLPVNHKKMEQLLKNTFGVIPIIYSEIFESTTYSQMRKTGCENIILSPVSGPTVQMKVRNTSQILEQNMVGAAPRNIKKKNTQTHEEAVEEGPQLKCTINDLPGGGFWQPVADRDPPTWKLNTFLECKFGEALGNFYFQGKEPPMFTEQGVWSTTDESGLLFFNAKIHRGVKKKKNWWENNNVPAEEKPEEKDETYKYLVEPAPEYESDMKSQKKSHIIHVKGRKNEKRNDYDSRKEARNRSKIIIKEAAKPTRASLILNIKRQKFASYSPVDDTGRTHPFFDSESNMNFETRGETDPEAEDIIESSQARTFDDGSEIAKGTRESNELMISKGSKRKRGREINSERGSVSDSAFFKGEEDEASGSVQGHSYRRKKKRFSHFDGPDRKKAEGAEGAAPDDKKNEPIISGDRTKDEEQSVEQGSVYDRRRQFKQTKEDEPVHRQSPEEQTEEHDSASGEFKKNKDRGSREEGESKEKEHGAQFENALDENETELAAEKERTERKAIEQAEAVERSSRIQGRKTGSVIAESTRKTLEELSTKAPALNRIKNTERVGIIPIKTLGNKGVLIVALGNNKQITKELMEQIRIKLIHHLTMRGQDPAESLDLTTHIDQVDFVDWCNDEMEFIALDRFGFDEVGVTFLPGDDIIPEVLDSVQNHMVAVELKCIKPDVPINFDIYIWMNENKRYVRYVKAGSKIDPAQLDRLVRFKTEFFHIKKEEVDLFRGYCAANYINIKIRDTKFRKAS
jgi:hypothetical protein